MPNSDPRAADSVISGGSESAGLSAAANASLWSQLLVLLQAHCHTDFSHYRTSSLNRGIQRRMQFHGLERLEEYLEYIHHTPGELDILAKHLLIGVTSFFRDPEGFAALRECLVPYLTQAPRQNDGEQTLRVWVPGCSTGGEAYSVAITLLELLEQLSLPWKLKVLATDLNAHAIATARKGCFASHIARHVSPQRLERFFRRDGELYHVREELRRVLVFAQHNIIKDPPFSHLDLVSCRNVLLYLNQELQQHVLRVLHYALSPRGILFVGACESADALGSAFAPLHRRWRIYQRRPGTSAGLPSPPFTPNRGPQVEPPQPASASLLATERLLLQELVPPSVLMHGDGTVIHIHGDVAPLAGTPLLGTPLPGTPLPGTPLPGTPLPGTNCASRIDLSPGRNLLSAVPTGLKSLLVNALGEAEANGGWIRLDWVPSPGDAPSPQRPLRLRIRRFLLPRSEAPAYLLTLGQLHPPAHPAQSAHLPPAPRPPHTSQHNRALALLQSTNEKLLANQEELQSLNEELQTSQRALLSLNQELQGVSEALHIKVEQLRHAQEALENALDSAGVGAVFLDSDLNITHYTSGAVEMLALNAAHVGRPLSEVLPEPLLHQDAQRVLRTLRPQQREVCGGGPAPLMVRASPYRTSNHAVTGVVLTVRNPYPSPGPEAPAILWEALARSSTRLFTQDRSLRYRWGSGPLFGHSAAELVGKTDDDLMDPGPAASLQQLKHRVLSHITPLRRRLEVKCGDRRTCCDLYLEPLRQANQPAHGLFGVITYLNGTEAGSS